MKETYSYRPVRFFLITNLMMWALWLGAAYLSYQQDASHGKFISALELAGLFSPVVTALWIIFTSDSAELKKNFYDKLVNLKLIKLWTIPAILLIMPGVVIVSIFISHIFFGQSLGQLAFVRGSPFPAGIVPAQLLIFLAPLLEEIGWRGYGIESLRGGRTFFAATIIFAALWLFWHIPMFFVNNYYHNTLLTTNPLFALNFVVSMIPSAVIINWLWYKNRGNILSAVIFHAVVNIQGILQMGQIAKCIETVVVIIIAAIVVIYNKKIFFEKFPAQIGYFGEKA